MTPSWDERYQIKAPSTEPSDLLQKFSRVLPSNGYALDLACGGGRNSVFLAQCGLRVAAVDRSRQALEQGRELARQKNVQVEWHQSDLESFEFPPSAFDVVVVFYYRDPKLYPHLCATVRPGGLVIYQTFTREQLRFDTGPRNPAHLLDKGELLEAFKSWEVLFYRETWVERGVASLVARKRQVSAVRR